MDSRDTRRSYAALAFDRRMKSRERPGRTDHQHRSPVAPRVEDAHRRVHQPDIRMHRDGQSLVGDLGITLRDTNGMLLMHAGDDLGRLIAQVIYEAVVQAAVAGSGVEADIGNPSR